MKLDKIIIFQNFFNSFENILTKKIQKKYVFFQQLIKEDI